jgi:hypothetical protein
MTSPVPNIEDGGCHICDDPTCYRNQPKPQPTVAEVWEEETRCCMCNNWSAGGSRRTICRSCELDMREQAREERANRSW